MKRFGLFVMVVAVCAVSCGAAESAYRDIPVSEVEAAFQGTATGHPRLFMGNKDARRIRDRIQTDARMMAFYKAMLDKADGIIKETPVKRIKTGKRLLGVSRECLDRVIHLAAAYRLSGNQAYAERAEGEMLAAAGFSDWNPSHFLDVAEMTTALGIGYDWVYGELSADSRKTIRDAIVKKGINPSLKHHGWARGGNNWNQVCNGGMVVGALAIMEDEPELARQMVHRAVNGVQVVMKHYEPDGAYPEGPGYWVYGTSYNVVLLSAMESVLGTDFGLSKAPGLSNCAQYYLHVAGPSGRYFNYPDSGSSGSFCPAVFWFANKYDDPSLAWRQYQVWDEAMDDDPSDLVRSRLAPLLLAWCDGKRAKPKDLSWQGRGSNSVAMFRSSWTDPDAVYLAIKGGSPSVSHGHMDVGSFVLDAEGVRWAADLGPESYHKIESRGMSLWGRSQDAERWTIFRYNNTSHSTLVVDGQHQLVKGTAPIYEPDEGEDGGPFPHVGFDLSGVYEGQLAEAFRGAALLDDGQVVIQDMVKAADKSAKVRWAMVTPAEVTIADDKMAYLKQDGKVMRLNVVTDEKVKLRTWSTAPKADYDAPNPGTRLIGFEAPIAAGAYGNWAVYMIAYDGDEAPPVDLPTKPLWND